MLYGTHRFPNLWGWVRGARNRPMDTSVLKCCCTVRTMFRGGASENAHHEGPVAPVQTAAVVGQQRALHPQGQALAQTALDRGQVPPELAAQRIQCRGAKHGHTPGSG